jgi:hypothetical protein
MHGTNVKICLSVCLLGWGIVVAIHRRSIYIKPEIFALENLGIYLLRNRINYVFGVRFLLRLE